MKKVTLFIAMAFFCLHVSAQVNVDGIDINTKENLEYVEILGVGKLNGQVVISIDYGQKRKLFKPSVIKGPDGKNRAFNSMVDALNFFNSNGWEYVNSYAVTIGNSNVYHYLLKRKE